MRFLFFLAPFCEGAPPAGGRGENLFPGDYDYIRQGRGHNVCLAVSRDGAEQAVDVCFDLTAAPAGDFSLAFDGGLTLAYSDADRTCCLTFTDAAMSGGRTSRCVVLDEPCRRLRVVGDASSLEIFLNDGAAVLSTRYYPAGGQVTLRPANFTAAVYPLNL